MKLSEIFIIQFCLKYIFSTLWSKLALLISSALLSGLLIRYIDFKLFGCLLNIHFRLIWITILSIANKATGKQPISRFLSFAHSMFVLEVWTKPVKWPSPISIPVNIPLTVCFGVSFPEKEQSLTEDPDVPLIPILVISNAVGSKIFFIFQDTITYI